MFKRLVSTDGRYYYQNIQDGSISLEPPSGAIFDSSGYQIESDGYNFNHTNDASNNQDLTKSSTKNDDVVPPPEYAYSMYNDATTHSMKPNPYENDFIQPVYHQSPTQASTSTSTRHHKQQFHHKNAQYEYKLSNTNQIIIEKSSKHPHILFNPAEADIPDNPYASNFSPFTGIGDTDHMINIGPIRSSSLDCDGSNNNKIDKKTQQQQFQTQHQQPQQNKQKPQQNKRSEQNNNKNNQSKPKHTKKQNTDAKTPKLYALQPYHKAQQQCRNIDETGTLYKYPGIHRLSPCWNLSTQLMPIIVWGVCSSIPIILFLLAYFLPTSDNQENLGPEALLAVIFIGILSCVNIFIYISRYCLMPEEFDEVRQYKRRFYQSLFTDIGLYYDKLWRTRYMYAIYDFKRIGLNAVTRVQESIKRKKPSLYFVVHTYNNENIIKQRLSSFNRYQWLLPMHSEPKPEVNPWQYEKGETHIYPILIDTYRTVSDNIPPNSLDNAIVDLGYTYTLQSKDDEDWLKKQKEALINYHKSDDFPYVYVETRYLHHTRADSILNTCRGGFIRGKHAMMIRPGFHSQYREHIYLGAGGSYDDISNLPPLKQLSAQGYGKNKAFLYIVDETNGHRRLYFYLGLFMDFIWLKWLFNIILRLTTKYIWVINIKELKLKRKILGFKGNNNNNITDNDDDDEDGGDNDGDDDDDTDDDDDLIM